VATCGGAVTGVPPFLHLRRQINEAFGSVPLAWQKALEWIRMWVVLAPHLQVNLHRFARFHSCLVVAHHAAAFLKALGADIEKMNATRLQQVESEGPR